MNLWTWQNSLLYIYCDSSIAASHSFTSITHIYFFVQNNIIDNLNIRIAKAFVLIDLQGMEIMN